MTPENVLKLIEALRMQGLTVVIRAIPDEADSVTGDGRYSAMIRGYNPFTGDTLLEAMRRLALSKCWESAPASVEPRSVKVADILDAVRDCASQYTTQFTAEDIATELGVFASPVGHALKKLAWPKSHRKATASVNGREIEVFVYLPRIG